MKARHVPKMQEPGCSVPCPAPVLRGMLLLPCLLAPEPRTSAQTKLTARPGGWCSPVSFLPSSPHWELWERKGPEVIVCHPVLGQQVRGEEGLPVEAGTAREAESREADAGAQCDTHTEYRRRNLRAEGTAQGGPGPQLQYKQQRCRRERVTRRTRGGGVKEVARGSHGGLSGSSPTLGNGGEPHLQMGADRVPQGVCSE